MPSTACQDLRCQHQACHQSGTARRLRTPSLANNNNNNNPTRNAVKQPTPARTCRRRHRRTTGLGTRAVSNRPSKSGRARSWHRTADRHPSPRALPGLRRKPPHRPQSALLRPCALPAAWPKLSARLTFSSGRPTPRRSRHCRHGCRHSGPRRRPGTWLSCSPASHRWRAPWLRRLGSAACPCSTLKGTAQTCSRQLTARTGVGPPGRGGPEQA
mmetsp:Transcript_2957/g.12087  ORF Transcript_2957/g.12087 Transcript_2957/m.12087 type:complete len:214 (-) Transcript_2957:364-1005(-)